MPSDWAALAGSAIARFEQLDDGVQAPWSYAYMASAIAYRDGWASPAAQSYLDGSWDERLTNPDGSLRGWSTTATGTIAYSISLVDHVGPVVAQAYASGQTAVTAQQVLDVARVLMATPRIVAASGWGISYLSQSASTTNVLNLTAGAALLLEQIRATGLAVPAANGASAETLAMQLSRAVSSAYQANAHHNWPYSSADASPNDCDHLGLLAEAALALQPALGRHVGAYLMQTAYSGPAEVNAALGHLRAGGTALGRPYADVWLPEALAYAAAQQNNPMRLAQIARWAARIAGGA